MCDGTFQGYRRKEKGYWSCIKLYTNYGEEWEKTLRIRRSMCINALKARFTGAVSALKRELRRHIQYRLQCLQEENPSLKFIRLISRAIEWGKSYNHSYDINRIIIEGTYQMSEFRQKVEVQIEHLTGSVSKIMERLTYYRKYDIGDSETDIRIHCWTYGLSGHIVIYHVIECKAFGNEKVIFQCILCSPTHTTIVSYYGCYT